LNAINGQGIAQLLKKVQVRAANIVPLPSCPKGLNTGGLGFLLATSTQVLMGTNCASGETNQLVSY